MTSHSRRKYFSVCAGLVTGTLLTSLTGCSGGSSVPTQIHEGGGTIPELVETPDTPAPKKKTPAKK